VTGFQAEQFVMRYLEASGCQILEKGDGYVTVKLSPEADKDLMNRSYYWSFVERTGVEPETMSFTFVFDPNKHPDLQRRPGGTPASAMPGAALASAAPAQASPVQPSNPFAGNGQANVGQGLFGQTGTTTASMGQPSFGQASAGQGQFGQAGTGAAGNGQTPAGHTGAGQTPFGQTGTATASMGQPSFGQADTGAAGNGQTPAGHPGAGQTPFGQTGTTTASNGQTPTGQAVTGQTQAAQADIGPTTQEQDSILGRYFGVAPQPLTTRIPSDICNFGSRRLEQVFNVTRARGKYVRLFEEPDRKLNPYVSIGYSTWLHINYKVEYVCDMKRDEIHSLGFHMGTGQIVPRFYDQIRTRKLSPQLPSNIHLQPVVYSLTAAAEQLEAYLKTVIQQQDHSWANEAYRRLSDEFDQIDAYYEELLRTAEPDKKAEIEAQYRKREQEIDWQYRPRIQVSVINCGFFHLPEGLQSPIDVVR